MTDFETDSLLDVTHEHIPTVAAQVSAAEVDNELRTNYEFFAEFFLSEEMDRDIPEFHHQTWGLMTSTGYPRIVLAIPRAHAKTTQAKLAVVFHFLFTDRRFCIYLSSTNTIALNACKDIFAFFQHPNFVSTYGNIQIETASEGNSLWVFKIRLRNGKWKRCILRAMGANQQMRGINIDNQRPDMAVVDDVEDLDNTESEKLQKKLDRWIFATFIKALDKNHKIVWIGNMLRKTSLLARLTTKPELKKVWKSLVLGALIKDPVTGDLESLWPELWTPDALRQDYKEYVEIGQAESWFCEMMNMPGQGENGFQMEDMYYVPAMNPDAYIATFITIDPAFGLDQMKHDASAIVVHGIPPAGPPHVITYKTGHFDELTMFRECKALAEYWRCYTWGIERVAAQKVLLTLFEVFLVQHRMPKVKLVAMQPSTHESKGARILAFVNMMRQKEYALPNGDLDATAQFLDYDMTMKEQTDDLIDGIAYGPPMLLEHKGAILLNAHNATREDHDPAALGRLYGLTQSESEVASV